MVEWLMFEEVKQIAIEEKLEKLLAKPALIN